MKGQFSAAMALEEAKWIVAAASAGNRKGAPDAGRVEARRHTLFATIVGGLDEVRLEVRNAETGERHIFYAQPRIVRALLRTNRTVGLVLEEDVVVAFVYY